MSIDPDGVAAWIISVVILCLALWFLHDELGNLNAKTILEHYKQ